MNTTGIPTRTGTDRTDRTHVVRRATRTDDRVLPGEIRGDRRHFVQLLAAGAAGAFAGAALAPQRAAAADGAALVLGTTNEASAVTVLTATNDTALAAFSDAGYGIEADGNAGNALFWGGGGAPVGGPAWVGTLWVDGKGDWWAATRSDAADGQWRKLAGSGTAGALHVLPVPIRVYDSRPGQRPSTVGTKSPLAPNTARAVDATQAGSGVPTTARAALITLTATGTGGPGFVAVWPGGTWPETSSINFSAGGQTIATTTVVGLAPGGTFLAQSNTTTDVIIDVVGYYQ